MGEHLNLSGYLIYTGGTKNIKALDLRTMETETLYESIHNVALFPRITKITDNKFIFDEFPITENHFLKEFDIKSKIATNLREGHLPTYIPESNNVFFYDTLKDSKEKWLYVSTLDAIGTARRVTKAPKPRKLPNGISYRLLAPVIQISSDEVVLVGEDKQLWIYNISESDLRKTGIINCFPKIWRNKTQQLICYDWELREYCQINLKTKHREELPQLKGTFDIIFIPKYDTLLYGKARVHFLISERYDVYAYNITNKKEIKFKSHTFLGSAIWVEKLSKVEN